MELKKMNSNGFFHNEKHFEIKNLVIRNAKIICPGNISEIEADIEIENGIIKSIGRDCQQVILRITAQLITIKR